MKTENTLPATPLHIAFVLRDAFGRMYPVDPGYVAEDDETLYTVKVHSAVADVCLATHAEYGAEAVNIALVFEINGQRKEGEAHVQLDDDGTFNTGSGCEIHYIGSGGENDADTDGDILREGLTDYLAELAVQEWDTASS